MGRQGPRGLVRHRKRIAERLKAFNDFIEGGQFDANDLKMLEDSLNLWLRRVEQLASPPDEVEVGSEAQSGG